MAKRAGNIKMEPQLKSNANEIDINNENCEPERKLTMREKLEIWRKEKGRDKPDATNPLLSRKRSLVSIENKQNVMKKKKIADSAKSTDVTKLKAKVPQGTVKTAKKVSGKGPAKGLQREKTNKAMARDPTKSKEAKKGTIKEKKEVCLKDVVTPQAEGKTRFANGNEEEKHCFDNYILEQGSLKNDRIEEEVFEVMNEEAEVSKNAEVLMTEDADAEESNIAEDQVPENANAEASKNANLVLAEEKINTRARETASTALDVIEEEPEPETGSEGKEPCLETSVDDGGLTMEPDKVPNDDRIAAFCYTPKSHTPSSRVTQKDKVMSANREDRRKTISLTPANRTPSHPQSAVGSLSSQKVAMTPFSSRIPVPTFNKTPARRRTLCVQPNSAPPRRSYSSISRPGFLKEASKGSETSGADSKTYRTQFRRVLDSLPPDSLLKSAPRLAMSSAKKIAIFKRAANRATKQAPSTPFKRVLDSLPADSVLKMAPHRGLPMTTEAADMSNKERKQNETPLKNALSRLPSNRFLRSAPLRRTVSHRQSVATVTPRSVSRSPKNNVEANEMERKKARRNTVHFTATDKPVCTPVCQAPFTPRCEWKNKELSIRERLDLWLAYKGNTVKKPFIVIKSTPARKRNTSPNTEDIGLNTTFTLESESDDESNEEEKITDKIPKMNEREKAVVEESLNQMIERIEKESDVDTIQEELDLILSTSPGVVRLASFWVVRARLAALRDNVDRVICLLEQANAFDAEPQSMIKDEICKYLEQLKKEQLENGGNVFPDISSDVDVDTFENGETSSRIARTPAKRVKFAESQQHVIFKSSLIKFCLFECTPFRKKLKSTLGRQVLTPVRRSGRIDKYESMLPPVVRSHVQTASSPGQFAKNIENGDVCFLPNPNVQSEWNDIWAMKDGDKDSQDRSF